MPDTQTPTLPKHCDARFCSSQVPCELNACPGLNCSDLSDLPPAQPYKTNTDLLPAVQDAGIFISRNSLSLS
jgi:hypothetical protein